MDSQTVLPWFRSRRAGESRPFPGSTSHVKRYPRLVELTRALRHGVRRYLFALPHEPTSRLQPERVEVGAAQVESEADGLSGQ